MTDAHERGLFGAFALACVLALPSAARASSGIDSPENGVVQLGRGGAWVARADDALAAYYNPAALAFQPHGVHLGAHLVFESQCFTRLGEDGKPVSPGGSTPGPGADGGPPAELCSEVTPFPNPQLAATFRLHDRVAIGLAVLGPHGTGAKTWPESIPYTNAAGADTTQPAPQRYVIASLDALLVFPTISASVALTDRIAVGAGFVWGLSTLEYVSFNESTSGTEAVDDFKRDLKSTIHGQDLFVPGFVVSVLATPTPWLDLAGWFKWQDAVRAPIDLKLQSSYWKAGGVVNETATNDPANITDEKDAGSLVLRIPMEARIGARYHHPRAGAPGPGDAAAKGTRRVRDPLAEDLFDVELDLTWAHNSVVENIDVCFGPNAKDDDPACPQGKSGIIVQGTTGEVPADSSIPHQWKDVIGVRLGGDFVVLPSRLALRAGGFFESKGQDDAYLNQDFHLGARIGVGGGATVRVGPVDISAAYLHTFFTPLDNGGHGAVRAISGSADKGYRSTQTVNGGRLTASLNEAALGATVRF